MACVVAGLTGALLAGWRAEAGAGQEPVEAVTPLLESGETVVGETIVYPTGAPAKVTAVTVTLEQGQETGWHRHGSPVFGYVLEGELTVDYGDKGRRVYKAGEALLEAIEVSHNGRNTGVGPVRLLAVFLGADGLKTTVPATK